MVSAERPIRVTTLGEVPGLQGWEKVTWRPLRRHLGIAAFGVNVFEADAGEVIIISHTEDDGDSARLHGGHEELYILLAGRVRILVGEHEMMLHPGQCVHVGDAAVERMAFAEESGTRILVVGGKPHEVFQPSAWEFMAAAFPYYRSRDYETALEILREGLEVHPRTARLLYRVACVEALTGEIEAASEHLRDALAFNPELAATAGGDPDLKALHAGCSSSLSPSSGM